MPAPATPTNPTTTPTTTAPTVATPATPATPAAPADGDLEALLSTFDDGGAGLEIQPAPEPDGDPASPAAPEAPVEPQPAGPAPADAPAAPAAPAPAVKVTRKPGVTQEQLDAAIAKIRPPLPPETPAAPAAPAAPAGPDLSKLSEDQRDEYETLLWAETNEPSTYAGKAKALLDGYQKVEAYIATRASSGEPVEDPASDGELQRFIASSVPKPGRSELRRLERARITKEAKDDVLKGVGAEIAEAKRLATVARVEPVVRGEVEKFKGELAAELASDDPFESDIYKSTINAAVGYAAEWLEVVSGITDNSPRFNDLFKFVSGEEAAFRAAGKGLVRDGKTFVTMAEWSTLTPEQKATRWVFNRQDVLGAFKREAVSQAKKAVEREEKELTARGFVRATKAAKAGNPAQPAAPATVPATTVAPIEAPNIGRSAAPGAGPSSPKTPEGREMTSTLGMS